MNHNKIPNPLLPIDYRDLKKQIQKKTKHVIKIFTQYLLFIFTYTNTLAKIFDTI